MPGLRLEKPRALGQSLEKARNPEFRSAYLCVPYTLLCFSHFQDPAFFLNPTEFANIVILSEGLSDKVVEEVRNSIVIIPFLI